MKYLDDQGRSTPPDGWYGPGHVYLGSLGRNRVARLTGSGKRVKIVSKNEGSTTVKVAKPSKSFMTRNGDRVDINGTSLVPLSRGTVVKAGCG